MTTAEMKFLFGYTIKIVTQWRNSHLVGEVYWVGLFQVGGISKFLVGGRGPHPPSREKTVLAASAYQPCPFDACNCTCTCQHTHHQSDDTDCLGHWNEENERTKKNIKLNSLSFSFNLATTRHGVTGKRNTKRPRNTGNLFRNNLERNC